MLSVLRRAVEDYRMIEAGDRIAVGLSGGKDSVAMMDDVIETFLLSLFYEGRVSCFSPVTYLDRVGLTLIRPFLYVRESEIRAFVEGRGVPVAFNPCPADGNTKRQEVKELIAKLSEGIPELKEHVFGALCRAGIDGWHPPTVSRRTPVRREER